MGNVGMSNTDTGNTGMMKLAQAAKVVQVPVAGQPGRYVTGLLPVLEEQKTSLPPPIAKRVAAVDDLAQGTFETGCTDCSSRTCRLQFLCFLSCSIS